MLDDKKKKRFGNVSFNVDFDLDTHELLDYFYMEDGDPPPLINLKIKKEEGERVRVS